MVFVQSGDLLQHCSVTYRVVQLNFTLEIEVFYMLFERSLKQNIENFHFGYKIQFDHLVRYLCGQHNYILDKISLNIVM